LARGGLGRAVIGGAGALARALPRPAALALGRWLGLLGYGVVGKRRRIALGNLALAFPGMTQGERRRIARASFAHLGMNAAEFLLLPRLTAGEAGRLVKVEGEERLREALAKGKGALVLTAHLGNWDLLAGALALRGFPISLISKISHSGAVNDIWMGYRERLGIRIFAGRNMARGILGHLRQGGVVGFVLDQNALPGDGVFVPFFGRPACTLSSLAVIASRTGAPVIPIHAWREGDGHRVLVGEAIEAPGVPQGDEGVLIRTAAYSRWTEEVIRLHPGQWTWLHDRWKTRPPEAAGSSNGSIQDSVSKIQKGPARDPGPGIPGRGGGKRPAVFLDRDGTLIDELGYLGDPEKVQGKILPGAAEAVRLLREAGYLVVVVSNQSGVGRGFYPVEAAQAVHLRLVQELASAGGLLSAAYFCPHLPDAGCACRKPAEGMGRRAAFDLGIDLASSWVVGDMDKDALLAGGLGARAAVVRTGHAEKGDVPPGTPVFDDVLAAARAIAGGRGGAP